ncbi:MAG: hypothetical protein HGA67_02880 [Candidatus Yonathbacteria bacterium]|nr:hypothetical protein [Candidatus Yonathbacteria bacterium]
MKRFCGCVVILIAAVNVHVSYTMPFPVHGAFLCIERFVSCYLIYFSAKFLFFERAEYVLKGILFSWMIVIVYAASLIGFVSPEPERFVPGCLVPVVVFFVQLVSSLIIAAYILLRFAEEDEERSKSVV